MKSKAIIFSGKCKAQVVEEEVGDPEPGEVSIELAVSLISTGTESFCYRGEFEAGTNWAAWVKYPFYPGYSGVGTIERIGAGVRTDLAVGERVFATVGHRQHAVTEAEHVVKLPDQVSDEQASWSALAFVTQTAVRRAEHAMGDTAAVIGLGPLGQLVVQYLRLLGLRQILAIDTVPMRVEAASKHGATAVFCGSAADARPFIAEHTDNDLADVVYDVTGHWSVLPLALGLARDHGRLILLGDSPHPAKQHLTSDVLTRQVTIIGTHNTKLQPQYAYWTKQRQIQLFYTYLNRGQMRVDDLITDRCRPDDAPQVYQRLQTDRLGTLGVIFDWRAAS